MLSGPSFAQEVAAGMPTAVVVASSTPQIAQTIQRDFTSSTLRVYTNDDVPGVELGGALKNVIALAAGVANGLNLGHNSSAALITRGIAEMTRLAIACGGRRQTLAGLSGVGDLVLTCTGSLSRNRAVGIELGRGRQLPEIIAGLNGKVAEGVRSTPPPSASPPATPSRCPSPSRWTPSSTTTKAPKRPSANSCPAPAATSSLSSLLL